MTFTIIIATCDRPERLARGLARVGECIAASGVSHRVVVADNSMRGSASDVVTGFAATTGVEALCLHTPPRNKAKALNAGIAAAKTEWLAFTDDDTVPDVNWLVEGARYAASSGLRVFGGRVQAGEPDGRLPRWMTPGRSGNIPGIGVFVNYRPMPAAGTLAPGMTAPFGANIFVRKDVFQEFGGYDEDMWRLCERMWPLGVEDSEFGYRLHQFSERIGYCHEALVLHPVNYDRCSLWLHLRRAYCEGWRQPLIFFDPKAPVFAPYKLRVVLGHLGRTLMSGATGDPAGSAYHLVEAARYAGTLTGRWSYAYGERREWYQGGRERPPAPKREGTQK